MVKIGFMHGYGVSDKGQRNFGPICQILRDEGFATRLLPWRETTVFNVRERTDAGVDTLLAEQPDILIAHSHANIIAHKALCKGFRPRFVVMYQPAMRRSLCWPDWLHGLIWYNPQDWAVRWGKVWRFAALPLWGYPWAWGTAGAYGFEDPGTRIRQVRWGKGHSYLHKSPWLELSAGVIKSIARKVERGDYDAEERSA